MNEVCEMRLKVLISSIKLNRDYNQRHAAYTRALTYLDALLDARVIGATDYLKWAEQVDKAYMPPFQG